MKSIKATTTDGDTILINEEQVATVIVGAILPGKKTNTAKVKMSNGDEFILAKPSWDEWENDLFVQ